MELPFGILSQHSVFSSDIDEFERETLVYKEIPMTQDVGTTRGRVLLRAAALDEQEGDAVFRGLIDQSSLGLLKVPPYQRELMTFKQRRHIRDALNLGKRLPDIVLALRGENFTQVSPSEVRLENDVFIVDGFQRISTALEYLEDNPHFSVRIGATIFVNPSLEKEFDLFAGLNQFQSKLSPNILLRNQREQSLAVLTLFGLSQNERDFPLYKRVQWGQNMTRNELVSASVLAKTAMHLFRHVGTTQGEQPMRTLVPSLDKLVDRIGIEQFRYSLNAYFSLMEECWGVRSVFFGSRAVWLRGTFMFALADLLSNHYDFWDAKIPGKLAVSVDIRRKLARFPVQDPTVSSLASSGSSQMVRTLHGMLRDFVNSGKRTHRLHSRFASPYAQAEELEQQDE